MKSTFKRKYADDDEESDEERFNNSQYNHDVDNNLKYFYIFIKINTFYVKTIFIYFFNKIKIF